MLTNLAANTQIQTVPAAKNPPQRFPLSYGQRAIWYLCQLAPESPVYNIARALRLNGRIDPERVQQAMNQLVKRHPILRTTFHLADGKPIQQIAATGTADFLFMDSQQQSKAAHQVVLQAAANKPFALDKACCACVSTSLLRKHSTCSSWLTTYHRLLVTGELG